MLDPEASGRAPRADRRRRPRRGSSPAATLKHDTSWGMRKMAYEIRQRTEADYRFFRFEGEPPLLDALDHEPEDHRRRPALPDLQGRPALAASIVPPAADARSAPPAAPAAPRWRRGRRAQRRRRAGCRGDRRAASRAAPRPPQRPQPRRGRAAAPAAEAAEPAAEAAAPATRRRLRPLRRGRSLPKRPRPSPKRPPVAEPT